VLVLDEPTNHLDIPSREALEEALDAYEGTILTISHDRYFLDRVATQILALDGEGLAEHYDGDYTEYHDWKASGRSVSNLASLENRDTGSESPAGESAAPPSLKPAKSGPAGKLKQAGKGKSGAATRTPAVKVIKKNKSETLSPVLLEAEIAIAEQRLHEISEQMSLPEVARDATELVKLDADYRQTETRLAVLYSQWEEAAAKG
jgi:ATP-binding cassette subfamily F protein 3